ncbi:TetR/AcrR family transcriptional regulator [Microbacterium atlanticum]|uniref:TetR/AcrR family transcriptional regulator n=1 Tax=Microbacterium atlanticum TaxID=2782168 RepID=UPI00188992CB|nr:TetR family transcriptional regulator [Microbacterium atlanticum]
MTVRRPPDPDRPRKITEATLAVIARDGIGALSHRAVAAMADVPLGATTYYFKTRDHLIEAATEYAAAALHSEVTAWFDVPPTRTTLSRRLAELTEFQTAHGPRRDQLALEYELYLAGGRIASLREINMRWDGVLRAIMVPLIPERAVRAVGALMTGLHVQAVVYGVRFDADDVEELIETTIRAFEE